MYSSDIDAWCGSMIDRRRFETAYCEATRYSEGICDFLASNFVLDFILIPRSFPRHDREVTDGGRQYRVSFLRGQAYIPKKGVNNIDNRLKMVPKIIYDSLD